MRRIIAVLLENEAGALSRVVGLFAQRNYNIDSLSVAPTEDPTLSRLTLTTSGDESKIEQIIKSRQGYTGLPTGYHRLDEMLSGLQPSDMIILAARPSVGKTAFALNVASNIATIVLM